MDEIYKHRIDLSHTHHDNTRFGQNCDTTNYGDQAANKGNRSLGFVSEKWNYLYGADDYGNGLRYHEEEKAHKQNDRSGRISPMLGRNYQENSSIDVFGNNGSRYGNSSICYEHNNVPSTKFCGLLASRSAAHDDETKSYTTSANNTKTAINGYQQATVDSARYSGKVTLYDVQNIHEKYYVPTYMYQGVNWTSPRDAKHLVTQGKCYSDTTSVTNNKNYNNETLPYGAGRSSSDNLQFYGSLYREHRETRQEITDGHCTTWSYQQQPSKLDDVTSRKRKLDCEKPDSSLKQEINNDYTASTPKVDKRALYSKYRVVKRKDQSQATNESTKVKPFLLRLRLGDQTIVDVNDQDGLPNVTKMAKIVPTLTPMKENEAEATIRNIEFITLDKMKVVRRKLEVVQLVRQEDERQERLKAEA